MNKILFLAVGLAITTVSSFTSVAHAVGVFGTPRFISPGSGAIGFEPELILSNGAGVGANVRYQYGLTDLNNVQAILGTGSGPRKFRVGGNATFDFFPDVEGQPGIGIATQAIYYRLKEGRGMLEVTAIPYLHKAFISGSNEIEPYIAIPFGGNFSEGRYEATSTFSVGSMFKSTESIRYLVELGVAINHAESYVSGGLIYYH